MKKEIGQRIIELRESRGIPRTKLADDIGYDQSNLGKVERGTYAASPELLKKIADYFNVSVAHLYGEEVEVPKELKDIGVEWITFAKEMQQKELTPEQIKHYVEVVSRIKKDL